MADTNTYDSFQKVEKWTTKDNFNKLDPRTIETGTEYNLTGAIDETDLDYTLQSKINGKLTTPTTPTADSAVTLLADGTVGTKPLSEIGGKLYRHQIKGTFTNTQGYIYATIVNTTNANITEEYFRTYIGQGISAILASQQGYGSVLIDYSSNNYNIQGAVNEGGTANPVNITDTFQDFTDTVIEL